MRGILDTSILIARESPDADDLPDDLAVSVMTLAELHVGVLLADASTRAPRTARLVEAERNFEAVPVSVPVARAFAALVAEARRSRRRPRVTDTLIAATALAHGVPVYTRDRDFARMAGVEVILVG